MGFWELVVIALLIVVLFGARRIPDMFRGLGSGLREFRTALRDEQADTDRQVSADKSTPADRDSTQG